MRRRPIGLGDLIEVFRQLEPDGATGPHIAEMLGYAQKIPETSRSRLLDLLKQSESDEQDSQKLPSLPHKKEDPKPSPPDIDTDFGPPIPSDLYPLPPVGQSAPEWMVEIEPLKKDRWYKPAKPPLEPLLPGQWARGILIDHLAARLPEGAVDVPRLVTRFAKAEPIERLPTKKVPRLRRHLQILLDVSEAMSLFRRDAQNLLQWVQRIVGKDKVRILTFRGCPSNGVFTASTGYEETELYAHPKSGSVVLLITDLGVGRPPLSTEPASPEDWQKFIYGLSVAGCRTVVFTPYGKERVPPLPKHGVHVVEWGRILSGVPTEEKSRRIPDDSEYSDQLKHISRNNPHALELAMVLSQAARVEPELMRAARLKLLPGADAACEADLWLSDLIESKTVLAAAFRPEIVPILRELISEDGIERVKEVWQVISKFRQEANSPFTIVLEEQLINIAMLPKPICLRDSEQLLKRAIKSIVDEVDGWRDLVRWTIRALPLLPERIRDTPVAKQLTQAAWLRTSARAIPMDPDRVVSGDHSWLLPNDIPRTMVQVWLTENGVVFKDGASEAVPHIDVPVTSPRIVDVAWKDSSGQRFERQEIKEGDAILVPSKDAEVEITTIDGRRYRLAGAEELKDFFISYSSQDTDWAEWIAWVLESEGYSTAMAHEDFVAWTNFVDWVERALRYSKAMIAVLSPSYLSSRWATLETDTWLTEHTKDESKQLLPIIVGECRPEHPYLDYYVLDLQRLGEHAAYARLVEVVRRMRPEPVRHPSRRPLLSGRRIKGVSDKPPFPADTRRIFNVPLPRNRYFTGREDILARIKKSFSSGLGKERIVVLHGLGGVGKTQTALEYSYRYQDEYSVVWWVSAEDYTTIASDYVDLAVRLGLVDATDSDPEKAVAATRAWLEEKSGWLLVFDDAINEESLQALIPSKPKGRVLITSRYAPWRGFAVTIRMDVMNPDEAVEFLKYRIDRNEDRAVIEQVAAMLDYLPLALEQASSYVRSRGITLTAYSRIFEQTLEGLLDRKAETGYRKIIITVFLVSFEQTRAENPASTELMKLLSYFAPDNVPLDIFRKNAKLIPEPLGDMLSSRMALYNVLEPLLNYSLIARNPEEDLSVHRLGQEIVRDLMSLEERERWVSATIKLLLAAAPKDYERPNTWGVWSRLLPHILAACDHAQEVECDTASVTELMEHTGGYLRNRAHLKEARDILKRALRLQMEHFGPNYLSTASVHNSLGLVLQDLGDFKSAREHIERALELQESAYEPDHPVLAYTLSNLGIVSKEIGDFSFARRYLERAIAIEEKAFGENAPQLAASYSNLATILLDIGEIHPAQEYMMRAIEIQENSHEPDHLDLAVSYSNLAMVLRDLGDLKEARDYLERVIAIQENSYELDQPALARTYSNLAMILTDMGELQEGRAYLERALKIQVQFYEPDHPALATSYSNLGIVLHELGNLKEAREYLERALKIQEKAYEADHPVLAGTYSNLGLVMLYLGDAKKAEDYIGRAEAIQQKTLGSDHPSMTLTLSNLAEILTSQNRSEEAENCLQKALTIAMTKLGPEHPTTKQVASRLSELKENSDSAYDSYSEALDSDDESEEEK
jgi:tetratricopeptide (TPR) repeat protein